MTTFSEWIRTDEGLHAVNLLFFDSALGGMEAAWEAACNRKCVWKFHRHSDYGRLFGTGCGETSQLWMQGDYCRHCGGRIEIAEG